MTQIQSAPHSVDIGGHRVAYRTSGDPSNPPVIFVHGWLMHSRNWRNVVAALEATHFCIALDLPGFADSAKPRDRRVYAIDAYARTVLALADSLGLARFALAGHSMGGQIALHLASALAPERVERLIAVAPVVTGRLSAFVRLITVPQMAVGHVLPFAVPPTAALFRHPRIAPVMFGAWFHRAPPFEMWREDVLRASQPDIVTPAFWSARSIMGTDVAPQLKRITAPFLIVSGRKDRIVSSNESIHAAEQLSGARLELFDDCGHFPFFEFPDKFNALVQSFLA
jgi:pimeloyl-ACP methyl ester carboxylesterase